MRLVQDLVLLACLLFTFNTANAANLTSPLEQIWARVQGTLDKVATNTR